VSDYEEIYQTYTQGDYTAVLDELDEKIPMMLNDQMLPKYELLRAVTVGKLEGLEGYKAALNHVALTYPTSKEGKEAERILNEDLSRLENMDFKMDLSKNLDRKSTRLNSSHVKISYAVFCLKNKPGSISLFS